jgi:hypothetical protein
MQKTQISSWKEKGMYQRIFCMYGVDVLLQLAGFFVSWIKSVTSLNYIDQSALSVYGNLTNILIGIHQTGKKNLNLEAVALNKINIS